MLKKSRGDITTEPDIRMEPLQLRFQKIIWKILDYLQAQLLQLLLGSVFLL